MDWQELSEQSEAEKDAIESAETTINSLRAKYDLPKIKAKDMDILLKKID